MAVEVEAIELPGAGIVNMTLHEMARLFGVPWAEIEGRLQGRRLTSQDDRGGMADGAALIHAVPTTEKHETQERKTPPD